MTRILQYIALAALLGSSVPASSSELVGEYKGSGSTTTPAFTVESPWILDWRLDSDYERRIALDLVLVDAVTGRFVGAIKSGPRGNIQSRSNGVRLFDLSGRFRIRVSSSLARWTLKVEQLTEEEAELYTPVRKQR